MNRAIAILFALVAFLFATPSATAAPSVVPGPDGGLVVALDTAVEETLLSVSDPEIHAERDALDTHLIHLRPAPTVPVTVRFVSGDGHAVVAQVSPTSVDGVSDRDPLLSTIGRGLLIAALCLVVGALAARRWVIDHGVRNPLRPPGSRAADSAPVPADVARIPGVIGQVAVGAGIVGGALTLLGTWGRLDLGVGGLGDLLLHTRLGNVVLAQTVALVVAGALIMGRRMGDSGFWVALAAPTVALVVTSASGHATAGSDPRLGLIFDGIHTLASAVWIGGLVVLLIALHRLAQRKTDTLATTAAVVVRFSAVALIAVAAIVVTGVYRGLAELPTVGALVDTGYGVALLVKLGLFAVMMAVATYNRFVLHPRLERAALGLSDSEQGASSALRTSVRAEVTLAVAVLVIVAVLIATPPPA